jgi:hypothetical protein
MKTAIKSSLTLPEVAEHFQQWRSRKQLGARIPDHLWHEAISLVGAYQVTHITRTLRLSSTDFNKRRRLIETGQHQPDAAGATAFVEINPQRMDRSLAPAASAGWLELERPDGLRLRIQPTQGAELLTLVERFMGV